MSNPNKVRLQQINDIIEEYQDQGYVLTLRQLYYQLVSRDIIPNKQKEYAKLSTILKEGRMAGIVDWDAIEDRLRKPSSPASFSGPKEILSAAINQFQLPRQNGQKVYMEVWVEKDALSGVLSRVTRKYHVPIMVNRGYSSASAMYDAYTRFKEAYNSQRSNVEETIVLYLGDFDPSGVDMIRDIEARIIEFITGDENKGYFHPKNFSIIPIALTKEQIETYNPPPNPAKITDPRAKKFIKNHGATSWEVDALRPDVLNDLLENNITALMDMDIYNDILESEKEGTKKLSGLAKYL